jgi:uncharacterized protein (TIGR03032 family)
LSEALISMEFSVTESIPSPSDPRGATASAGDDRGAIPEPAARRIVHRHDAAFVRVLDELGISLLVSTYQAGKLAVVQARGEQLMVTYHNFERAMGIALSPEQIALGTVNQVWFLVSSPPTKGVAAASAFDRYYLARGSHVTGEIHVHEMEWAGRELWVVNTLFSCLCTISVSHNFAPRWKPAFITGLAPEDRCHLNGLALENGRPRFVTCLGATDTPRGWKADAPRGGCLIDVSDGQLVLKGLSLPHSPRLSQGKLWFLESGRGRLMVQGPREGLREVAVVPGYARGLSFHGPYAFVGLSRVRQTSNLEGLPIAADLDSLKCGVAVIELTSGRLVAFLEFTAGLEEIFDVRVNPYARRPLVSGPDARNDGTPPIWTMPPIRL